MNLYVDYNLKLTCCHPYWVLETFLLQRLWVVLCFCSLFILAQIQEMCIVKLCLSID